MFRIYTDGSCRASGRGGLGVVWTKDDKIFKEYANTFEGTTNNQMELIAILVALLSIKKPVDELQIITDSMYSIGIITGEYSPVKNGDLVKSIRKVYNEKQKLVNKPIEFIHVDGHTGNIGNERANFLAQQASL